jgi:anti-sigma28 factor (negative regulator of flagellin synthesis)
MTLSVSAQNTFPASGNVGINTTSPGANLVVNGKTRVLSNLMVGADYDAPGFYQLYLQGTGSCELGFRDASQGTDQKVWATVIQGGLYRIMTVNDAENAIQDAFIIKRSGMTVTNAIFPSGNLLVGKSTQTNTGYMLDVNGTGRFNKVVVNSTGADFVFDTAYRLPALTGVENYIRANRHLPGIEPAVQMQEKGLDVGDNQTKLLQKIEELTLYSIEQEKQLVQQKKQLEIMQAQIEELKAAIRK